MSMFRAGPCSVRAISAPTRRRPAGSQHNLSRNEEFSILGSCLRNDTEWLRSGDSRLNDLQARNTAMPRI